MTNQNPYAFLDSIFTSGQTPELSSRDSSRVTLQSQNTDSPLTATAQLYRAAVNGLFYTFSTHNPTTNRLSTYSAYPLVMRNAYSTTVANRIVWLVVNQNKREGLNAQQKTVIRNSNPAIMNMFNTDKISGVQNPWNSVFVTGKLIQINIPAKPLDLPFFKQVNGLHQVFSSQVKMLNDNQALTDEERNDKLTEAYSEYQKQVKMLHDKGVLITTHAIIADDNGITPAISMHPDARTTNPFMSYPALAAAFDLTYIPTINSVSGTVQISSEPFSSELGAEFETGIRALNPNDRSANPRCEYATRALATDDRNQSISIACRIADAAWTQVNSNTERSRSNVFAQLVEANPNPTLFVNGTLSPMVVTAGAQDTRTGRTLFAINIEEYRQDTTPRTLVDNTIASNIDMSMDMPEFELTQVVQKLDVNSTEISLVAPTANPVVEADHDLY